MWVYLAVAHAGCDPMAEVARAEAAAVEGRVDAAADALAAAEELFGCGPVTTRDDLVRFWLTEGAVLALQGDDHGAAQSFRAAATLDAQAWIDAFGPALAATRSQALQAGDEGRGALAVDPAPGRDERVLLDGDRFVGEVPVGLHFVQIARDDVARFAQFVAVPADQTVVLRPPSVAAPMEGTARRSKGWLVGGLASGVVAAGAAGIALQQDGRMRAATTTDDLDAAWRRQQVFGTAAYALSGVAVTSLTLHVVTR